MTKKVQNVSNKPNEQNFEQENTNNERILNEISKKFENLYITFLI